MRMARSLKYSFSLVFSSDLESMGCKRMTDFRFVPEVSLSNLAQVLTIALQLLIS